MNLSILGTVKKSIGIAQADDSFDIDLLMFINTTLSILSQMGLKEADATPFINEGTSWSDLLGERTDLEMVKSYLHFKSKMMFDPPTNTALAEAIKNTIKELEWRIRNNIVCKEVMENEQTTDDSEDGTYVI